MVAQAVLGIIALEYSWSKTSRYRNVVEERDASYPIGRRLDVKKWARWKFYPGAMLFMPTRILLFSTTLLLMTVLVKLLSIGHNFKKGPIGGCRKKVIFFVVKWLC
jgi:hypothetical protein